MNKIVSILITAVIFATSACAQKKNQARSSEENKPKVTYKVKTLATVSNETLFSAITNDYKGKVVLIDFWATWCGPCRKAMTDIDQIKPALMKKGVAFVYVTGETSPEATWTEMIKKIDGDHYRLTNEQWKYLCENMGITGIPCYLLLDKKGNVAYSNVGTGGYPGNEFIQKKIEQALSAE